MPRYRAYCRCNRIACATCVVTPSGPHLKSHRAFLAPGMPEAKWLRTCNPYSGWKVWRDWTPPKPFVPETTANIQKRERAWLRSARPAGYSWRLEKLTPEQRYPNGAPDLSLRSLHRLGRPKAAA